ncbi:hypothetical protein [uncultured Muribaculum sp.]|uniref:Uncharacterized protein n=1 Tax=Muribaculum caecicola TaxID=3038144 RepID=A0AC61S4W4_9BACT|nr:hypothetical protein E5990_06755 [Muribaculum caecicola]
MHSEAWAKPVSTGVSITGNTVENAAYVTAATAVRDMSR